MFRRQKLCFQTKSDTPVTIVQKEQLYKLADRHKLILDYDIERLIRSEANHRTARLPAEYGR